MRGLIHGALWLSTASNRPILAMLSHIAIARNAILPSSRGAAPMYGPNIQAPSVQLDAPEHGWTSGRITVAHDTTIDLPTQTLGENQFRVSVFDGSGLPISHATSTIAITRTHSTAAAIPATQTIAVKVRTGSGTRNTLQPLIKKGTPLPASGHQPLKAAYAIGPNLPGEIDLELFQDEGAPEPDLNLAIGSFRICHHDLPEGMMIKEGDPVFFHWSMNDSGVLTVSVELPSLRQRFSSGRFYVDQEGRFIGR